MLGHRLDTPAVILVKYLEVVSYMFSMAFLQLRGGLRTGLKALQGMFTMYRAPARCVTQESRAADSVGLGLLDKQESVPALIFLVLIISCLALAYGLFVLDLLSPTAVLLAVKKLSQPPSSPSREKLWEELKTEQKAAGSWRGMGQIFVSLSWHKGP